MEMHKMMIGMALSMAVCTGTAMAQAGGANGGAQQPGTNSRGGMNSPDGMNSMNSMNQNGQPSQQDRMFLRQASMGDMLEIKSSQLALQKSNSDDVKQFAQLMIDDHTKLDNEMKPIASQVGVTPPTELKGKAAKEYAKLQGLSGSAFDQAYIKQMVMDHKKVDQAFATEASSGSFPAEKQAAETNKPMIDMHLQKAEALAQAHHVTVKGM